MTCGFAHPFDTSTAALSHKFTADDVYIQEEIERSGKGTLVFALVPEHITGKLIKES